MSVSVLTFNLWALEREMVDLRLKALVDLVKSKNIPILCFQEVSPSMLRKLKQHLSEYSFLTKGRIFVDSVVIAFRAASEDWNIECENFEWHNYQATFMKRGLLVAHLSITSTQDASLSTIFCLGTTHLESPRKYDGNKEMRMKQLAEALQVLEEENDDRVDRVVLLGDLNWIRYNKFRLRLPEEWKDLWKERRPKEEGFTYDQILNPMLSKGKTRGRLDRVLVRNNCEGIDIEMIGREPISDAFLSPKWARNGEKVPLLISDHYGLLSYFKVE